MKIMDKLFHILKIKNIKNTFVKAAIKIRSKTYRLFIIKDNHAPFYEDK